MHHALFSLQWVLQANKNIFKFKTWGREEETGERWLIIESQSQMVKYRHSRIEFKAGYWPKVSVFVWELAKNSSSNGHLGPRLKYLVQIVCIANSFKG